MMKAWVRKVFKPPVFEDDQKSHQAYLLNVILWGLIALPLPYVAYALITNPYDASRALTQGGGSEAINLFLLFLLKRGYTRAASILQVALFWAFFTISAVTGVGVQGESYLLGYPLVIMIAGILLGGGAAAVVTGLSLLSGLYMVYAAGAGLVDVSVERPVFMTWVVSLAIFLMSALLQYLSSQKTSEALRRARQSEERYRLISHVSSDYAFESRVDGNGDTVNTWLAGAIERMTGYATGEDYIAAGGWYAHIHPEDMEKDAEDMRRLHSNKEVNSEIRTFTKNGELRWERIYAHPVWNAEENRLAGILGAVQDITGQKLAEERETRRQLMLEKVIQSGKQVTKTGDLATTLDRIWHAIHDNLGFDRLGVFLYNPEEHAMDSAIGTDTLGNKEDTRGRRYPIAEAGAFSAVLEKPDGLFFTKNYAAVMNIQPGNEMYGVKDYAAVAVWAGNKPVAAIAVDNLVTQRAIEPEQLEALRLFAGYAGLSIENARLHSALQKELETRQNFIEELEAKNAELERFTYTVSHDLKSPLVTINGFLGYLDRDAHNGKLDQFARDMGRVRQAVEKMQALLNDLLELSRIGRIINEPVEVEFGAIVRDALSLLDGPLTAGRARVIFSDEGHTVFGDRVRLTEVVQNLVENSVKFMGGQPAPEINIGSLPGEDGQPVFFVRDNGMGIAPEYQDRIFGLFNKLDANTKGTGIGLTLVKRIVEVHHGRIWLESQPGRGATFYFTLQNAGR